jgi:hypothetical protein
MRLNYILLTFLFGSLPAVFACSKGSSKTTVHIEYAISGTMYVKNYYTDSVLPLINTPVYIGKDTPVQDTSQFFYSVTTDSRGNFMFYVTQPDSVYKIFASPSIQSSPSFTVRYFGSVRTDSPYIATKTYVDTAYVDTVLQRGINFTIQDTGFQRIAGATVFLYPSKVVATADSSFSGIGIIYSFTTDSRGKGFVSQLPAGPIYVNSVLMIDKLTTLREVGGIDTVKTNHISLDTLTLK